MGQIQIQSTPRVNHPASVFDPSTDPAMQAGIQQFSRLQFVGTPQTGNVGGRFCLPLEFDSQEWASKYAAKGQEVLSLAQDQPVLGTGYISEGWVPWLYPEHNGPDLDAQGKQKVELKPNPDWSAKSNESVPKQIEVPIFLPHPLAGQTHEVPSQDANGITYVLMKRPLIVQQQVNEVYGALSIDQMTAEVFGENIATQDARGGMLGEKQLRRAVNLDTDIAADRAAEENMGRSTVVHSTLESNNPVRLTRPPQRMSR